MACVAGRAGLMVDEQSDCSGCLELVADPVVYISLYHYNSRSISFLSSPFLHAFVIFSPQRHTPVPSKSLLLLSPRPIRESPPLSPDIEKPLSLLQPVVGRRFILVVLRGSLERAVIHLGGPLAPANRPQWLRARYQPNAEQHHREEGLGCDVGGERRRPGRQGSVRC